MSFGNGHEDDQDLDEDDSWEAGDDEATIDCPHCGSEIYEDAQRCPQCGAYLSDEDAPPQPKPLWFLIGAALSLYIVYRWIVG